MIAMCQVLLYTYLKIKGEAMTPIEVKKYYKSSYRFHKVTGMSASTLLNWLKWGFVPEDAQYKLERITKGELKTQWSK